MPSRIILIVAACTVMALAQDITPTPKPEVPDVKAEKVENVEDKVEDKEASAGAEAPDATESKVVAAANKEKIRILKPQDVPAEMVRLKSKADIKAEITVRTTAGAPVTFKGVIRNGKLIERIVNGRFVNQKNVEHPRCGVRIWWSGGSDGYIFFRYSVITTLAITGRLTDAERREIMRKLQAKREGKTGKQAEQVPIELSKMNPEQLKVHLLKNYPYDKGWDHKRMRALKRKKLIENKALSREEEVFIKYFPILVEAHFDDLKRRTKKVEIEPGSEKKPESSGAQPSGDEQPFGDEPSDDEPSEDEEPEDESDR